MMVYHNRCGLRDGLHSTILQFYNSTEVGNDLIRILEIILHDITSHYIIIHLLEMTCVQGIFGRG